MTALPPPPSGALPPAADAPCFGAGKTVSYPDMKTTVSSKGQIVLPAEIRRTDRIEAGQQFEIERLGRGEYRLRRCARRPNEGLVDWLLECPSKGYFVSIEGESTDEL